MKFLSIIGTFVFLAHTAAIAAPRVGNGGGVWTCEDRASRSITWLRFVDLFEAEHEFGLKVEASEEDPWVILEKKKGEISELSPALRALMKSYPVNLKKVVRFLPGSSGLTVIEDALIRVRPLPESCPDGYLYYGQLANFTFDGRLLISSKFWKSEHFTNTERGALLVHELVYKAMREGLGDNNSSRARHIVGILFSEQSPRDKAEQIESVLTHLPDLEEEKY